MIGDGCKEKMREFKRHCRQHGLRITPQRIAIYERLSAARNHPSATKIHRQVRSDFPDISLGTVNSTLLTFAEIGLACVVGSSGEPKRFDPDTQNHHHFRCVKCSRIVDFHNEAYDTMKVPAAISKKHIVFRKKMTLEGLCDTCQKKIKEVHHGKRRKKTYH